MLYKSYSFVVTLLADGRACYWNYLVAKIVPKIINDNPITMLKVCPYTDVLLALTYDGQVLIGSLTEDKLIDITNTIYESLEKDLDCVIDEIHIDGNFIIVRIENSVMHARISWSSRSSGLPRYSLTNISVNKFEHSIDLVSFGRNHGFVRTGGEDGLDSEARLHSTGITAYYQRDIHIEDHGGRCIQKVVIPNTQDISKIICGNEYTLLLMNDGSVSACGLNHGNLGWHIRGPFASVQFPERTQVTKIIHNGLQIFYITNEGLCYHTSTNNRCTLPGAVSYCLQPTLLRSLDNYFVDNIFILKCGFIIIQHSSGKLCWLLVVGPLSRTCTNGSYTPSEEKPKALPFFDDKCIIVVSYVLDKIYFTTDGGNVYCCDQNLALEPQIKSIPFFNDNPIAVECNAARIRSAANTVGRCHQN